MRRSEGSGTTRGSKSPSGDGMEMITAVQLRKIRDYAMHMDWDVAFGGKSRGNRHLFRINRLVRALNDREGGDRGITEAGAWLHDVGLVKGNRGHCFKGAPIARRFLLGIGIDGKSIARIAHCIEAHDGEVRARTVEAKLVHDADTLDKMGPLGFIRHTWKLSNVDYKDYTVDELLDFIPGHLAERLEKLYLDSAKEIGRRLDDEVKLFLADQDNARIVVGAIGNMARKGIPTERVIGRLKRKGALNFRFLKVVEGQLKLSFLDL